MLYKLNDLLWLSKRKCKILRGSPVPDCADCPSSSSSTGPPAWRTAVKMKSTSSDLWPSSSDFYISFILENLSLTSKYYDTWSGNKKRKIFFHEYFIFITKTCAVFISKLILSEGSWSSWSLDFWSAWMKPCLEFI